MKIKWSALIVPALLLAWTAASADDGIITNKRMTGGNTDNQLTVLPEDVFEEVSHAEHAFTDMMKFYVPSQAASGAPAPDIDLGAIPDRPRAPEFPFERFLQTRPLDQLQFSPDNRSLYFTRNDGRVQNLYVIDLSSRTLHQVTHFDEPVTDFLPDHRGRFLILAQDTGGNENFDLYRFDLASGERVRLTAAGDGDTTMLCGLSPDDRLLYYAQTRDHRREAGLWQVEVDTGAARELLPGDGHTYDCERPSADGRYLLFGELVGFDERHLGLLDLATGARRSQFHPVFRQRGACIAQPLNCRKQRAGERSKVGKPQPCK